MRDSNAGDVVSGDTKPFSGWWSSVSSWTTAIAGSHIEASLCNAAGLAVQPVDSTMRQCPHTGERGAQSTSKLKQAILSDPGVAFLVSLQKYGFNVCQQGLTSSLFKQSTG